MNFCIIGMGFIFSRHVESIEKIGGKVLLTCDIDEEKEPDFTDYKEMFKSEIFKECIDVVVICTPNYLHKEMIKASFAAGKRVLCEKPLIIDNDFSGLDGVNTVLQLRYHSMIDDIKKELTGTTIKKDNIDLIMKVCRDDKWWKSWRGDIKKSGGILIGLAIHMFDLVMFLLGDEYLISESKNTTKKCYGEIEFSTAVVKYYVEVLDNDNKKDQTRKLIINGKSFELCDKDNLSFAGYHDRVYEEFIKDNGIPLSETEKAIKMVLSL